MHNYFEKIKHLYYVVQRNWEKDPYQEEDLDLFVSLSDRDELEHITKEQNFPFKVDIRSPGDGYYPSEIEQLFLKSFVWYGDIKIPTKEAHFFSLYYHNAVHKKEDKYGNKLRELFLEIYKPVEPQDKGVGYYVNR